MKKTMVTTVAAGFAFAALQGIAQSTTSSQDDHSGVAHPPEALVTDTPAPTLVLPPVAKPSAAVPATSSAVPAATAPVTTATSDPGSQIVEQATPTLKGRNHDENYDSMIVTEVPASANELPTGTLVRIKINQALSTQSTAVGTTLLGELSENVVKDGRVMIPAGTAVTSSVTEVRGGKRIHGAALIHIEPRSLTLANGTKIPLHASLIDTDRFDDTRIDHEGDLVRRDHVGGTLAAMSLTTGSVAAVGGVVGGPAGALIGAAVGAGASTVWWLKQDRQLHVTSGATLIFQLTSPIFLNGGTAHNGAE